ncbi:MAG: transglutaminase family protein [Betaproteobacteria bacterium]|nr:transglutaminase family protein [Betaproteobacteria bacterium]
MVRMEYQVKLQYEAQGPCDFVFNICAARTRSQRVLHETLTVEGATPSYAFTDPMTANRINRMYTDGGPLTVRYRGSVELDHVFGDPATIEERSIRTLPSEVLPYVLPSRYCPSDKMRSLAMAMFGNIPPGYGRVAAICEWVTQHVRFKSGASDATTCALQTFDSRVGVCRDYAHLMIAICRALNIPARYVTGVDYGADPALGPTDFHAYVEVFLGQRWYLFDATGMTPVMGLIRIGTGRDAADVSFATLFGNIRCARPVLGIEMISRDEAEFEPAASMQKAVSTANGSLYYHAPQAVPETPRVSLPMPLPIPGPWAIRPATNIPHAPHFA